MLQIFDCASIIGRRLASHDVTATLLVSQMRQTDIDLYRLPTKSIINPGRVPERGVHVMMAARRCMPSQLSQFLLSLSLQGEFLSKSNADLTHANCTLSLNCLSTGTH